MKSSPELVFYILIPYYNDWQGLIRSLLSINYKHDRYGILIVDDGSDEPIVQSELLSLISPQPFIKIIRMPLNRGITEALNTGLAWLNSMEGFRYIARLDCGDVCAPERFYRQVEFMEAHPSVGLLGSWCMFKDPESGKSYLYKTPTHYAAIVKGMHFRNLFIHPTVMWRASLTRQTSYPYDFPHAEDYGLFYWMVHRVQCTVLPDILVTCRINPKGLSIKHRRGQLKSRLLVVRQFGNHSILTALGIMRLRLLMLVPYRVIMTIKSMLYQF